ncbi:MAG: 50S ribosomal protein L4 [Candidatus Harrisonbacteria bacterium]|nr:50S ribosomal protein L4 [Candidatus Harrisonbacteria bacterium]
MENIKVYNQDGNVTSEMAAPVFLSTEWNAALVHQVFKSIAANLRQPVAHTKTRGEISGGGIKPWRQKGTGRARHGSIRSPLWRHGGVSFGPRNTTDFSQKTNKKMLQLALNSALSKKLVMDELKILNKLELPDLKTKSIANAVKNLSGGKSALLVVANENKNVVRAARNLSNLDCILAENLNVFDVLNHKYILIDQKALKELSAHD